MDTIVDEVKLWNTPLVGAFLLWKFTQGYTENHPSGEAPIGLLHFIALPILSTKRLSNLISDKRDGLPSFVRGFEDNKTSDLLLTIPDRINDKKIYTLQALDIAIAHGLLVWEYDTGKVIDRKLSKAPDRGFNLKPTFDQDGKKAFILGKWFSKHDLNSIASYLKIIL